MTEVRVACRDDLSRIVAMLRDDPLGQSREAARADDPAYAAAWEAIERDPNQRPLVLDDDGEAVGCARLTFVPGLSRAGMWRGQIEGVRVARSHRGRGAGRLLIERAVELCRERGCGLVQLTTDKQRPDALRFYEGLGFAASHEGMEAAVGVNSGAVCVCPGLREGGHGFVPDRGRR